MFSVVHINAVIVVVVRVVIRNIFIIVVIVVVDTVLAENLDENAGVENDGAYSGRQSYHFVRSRNPRALHHFTNRHFLFSIVKFSRNEVSRVNAFRKV